MFSVLLLSGSPAFAVLQRVPPSREGGGKRHVGAEILPFMKEAPKRKKGEKKKKKKRNCECCTYKRRVKKWMFFDSCNFSRFKCFIGL